MKSSATRPVRTFIFLVTLSTFLAAPLLAEELGPFDSQADVGHPAKKGAARFNAQDNSILVTGGGANMWFTNDDFHFVWTKVSGNFSLAASPAFIGTAGNAHRKACLMVRASLEPGAPYIDVAVHGDGLTSLQFRDEAGANTHEIQAMEKKPGRVAIERQGDVFFMSTAAEPAGQENPSGAFMRVRLPDPLYVGLAVCSHDDKVTEQARFAKVQLQTKPAMTEAKPVLHCSLEVVPIASGDRRVVYHTTNHIEAPNWSKDGQDFYFNANGHILRMPISGGTPAQVDTGSANHCNNDHGFSPDGKSFAISDQSKTGKSMIYVLPAGGGAPRLITPEGPSYWHGWSPDGSTLVYCAERNSEFDIYSIPVQGGTETRLTTAKGLDDGPDFSPDGNFIYFNSERTGLMQIWRMKPDGSDQEQVTKDDYNNWFAHPSPDGKWLVFLTFEKDVVGHPANQAVRLRLMPVNGGPVKDLARLFGGQGTLNVPSWSPDSRQLAFVSYELLH